MIKIRCMKFKIIRNALKLLITALVIALITGCGYHIAGTGKNPHRHLHTIHIQILNNVSDEPLIQRELTDSIRNAFLTDARLALEGANKADLVLKGTIYKYKIRPVAFNANDIAIEYIVTIGVKILVKDQVKNRLHLREQLRTYWDYRARPAIVTTEANREEALQEAYQDLAARIVSLVIDKF